MSTSRTTVMKGDHPEIYPVGYLPDKPDILERPLETNPSSFDRDPTIMNSRFTVPTYYQGEASINPDTLYRPKDTPIGIRTTALPPTGGSETTQRTPTGKRDSGSRRHLNSSFPNAQDLMLTRGTFNNIRGQVPFTSPPPAQALPNSSVASPIPGFHAWNESEKINALTAVHSLQTIIQTILLPNFHFADDSDEKSLHASLSSYMEFVNYLVESRLPERTGSLQARAICLVVLAGVAVFLGVVQLLTLALMAGVGVTATGQNSSSTVGKVINIFAFCGISFDTLGAMFALWTFRSLILTISKIEKIVFEKQNLNAKIHFTLDTFSVARDTPSNNDTPSKSLVKLFADFQQSSTKYHMEAREVVHLIDDHLPVQEDCITLAIIAAGLLFFFVSLFSFIISAQPLSVWASTTVVVAVTFIILRINLSHQQPGSWRSVMWRVRTTITKFFPLKNTGASKWRPGEGDEDDDGGTRISRT